MFNVLEKSQNKLLSHFYLKGENTLILLSPFSQIGNMMNQRAWVLQKSADRNSTNETRKYTEETGID